MVEKVSTARKGQGLTSPVHCDTHGLWLSEDTMTKSNLRKSLFWLIVEEDITLRIYWNTYLPETERHIWAVHTLEWPR